MTGEITLRGKVLPVGGIKEKVLAAHRAGITTVILPKRNEKDLEDVPEDVRKEMRFEFVDTIDEVLDVALEPADAPPTTARRPEPARISTASEREQIRRALDAEVGVRLAQARDRRQSPADRAHRHARAAGGRDVDQRIADEQRLRGRDAASDGPARGPPPGPASGSAASRRRGSRRTPARDRGPATMARANASGLLVAIDRVRPSAARARTASPTPGYSTVVSSRCSA